MAGDIEVSETTAAPVDLREQFMAGDEPAVEVAAETVDEDADEADPVEAADDEAVEAASDDEDAEPADEEDEESDLDPKAQKGIDAIRRAEKRHREKMDADRAEFAKEREQHQAALDEVAEFKTLAKRAKYDPGSVLRALGMTEDDFAAVAQAIYAESKEGAADPKRKAAAQHVLREREKEDKLTATQKRLEELETKLERQTREQAERAEVDRYVAEVTATAKAKHPLAANLIEKDPETANAGILAAYERLTAKGKQPKPAEVVAEYDRHERARFKRLGLDPDAIAKPVTTKPGAKPVQKVNGTAKPSKALSRDEIIAQLEANS